MGFRIADAEHYEPADWWAWIGGLLLMIGMFVLLCLL